MSTPASQLPLPAYQNRQLFSDHVLAEQLPRRPEWRALAAAARPVREAVAARYAAFVPSDNEAQTEHDLIRPVLHALGHAVEVQPSLRVPGGVRKPDYILYRDAAALAAHKGRTLDEETLRPAALAVGEAKHWDRPLDVTLRGGDTFSNQNPAAQIAFYIQHSGVEWGILTNGRRWRLYHRETAHRLDRYYEVDLPALLATGDADAFLYFYAFFHRSAFEPHPLGVAALRQASLEYARGVGEGLKGQVYDALRHLAQGFLDYAPNGLRPDPATLAAVYDNALIVLYRLLFILYAEARDLLPLRDSPLYRDRYSLDAIKKAVARDLDQGLHLLADSATLWPRLHQLFRIIDAGSLPLKVATFNGGLFDPARHPFLERYRAGDGHLQRALDKLARVGGQFVDYRDLAERHLGTIYEGLLEYRLTPIAPADGWTIALENDKGERKATGSYYTPDYIVKYIVEQAVGPALRAAVAGATTEAERIAAVLAVNVLDPAMGSGHFLVEAMEYIARFLVDLAPPPAGEDRGEGDLAYWKRRVAQSCLYGVDLNPLAVDLAKLSLWLATAARDRPLSFLDHHLRAGNTLVGARLADLRPDGAAAPARRGPSRRVQQAVAAGQLSLLDDDAFRVALSTAVDSMWLIEGTAGLTLAEVKEQERLYTALRERLIGRYGRLADLVTAAQFGLAIDPGLWELLTDYATGRTIAAPAPLVARVEAAAALAAERRFFHWELEFPEVFFDRHGRPLGERAGFDAVIGNPPYIRQEQVRALKPYLAAAHAAVYDGVADLYVYFYHRGLELLQAGGRLSYIVTNKWLRAGYGEPLRAHIAASAAVEQIVDFGHAPIFPDADTFPCIVVLRKRASDQPPDSGAEAQVCRFPREALGQTTIPAYVGAHAYRVPARRFGAQPWSLEPAEVEALMAKIRRAGVPLNEIVKERPYRGLLTGLTEAFVINQATHDRLVQADPRLDAIIKPYLRGQDMLRWVPEAAGLWLIIIKSSDNYSWPWSNAGDAAESIFQQTYPAIYKHLKPFEEKLRNRQDKGRYWWELRSCNYYDLFDLPKIFYPDIAWRSQFSLDTEGYTTNNTVYFLPTASLWLLVVLNSPLMWSFCWRNAVHGKDEALRFFSDFVESIPIAPPTDASRAEVEPAVTRLIALTKARRAAVADVLAWLRLEFGVETPGQRLAAFPALDADAFVEAVRQARPRAAGRLSPAALRDLRAAHADYAAPIRAGEAEVRQIERRLAELVNAAYGLTPADVDLLWRTAPPRMPGEPPA